jgi:hypothetical protein
LDESAPPIAGLGDVQTLPLGSLRPYPANARRISAKAVEQTARSLKAFGWQQPMVSDPGLVLIVGHVRHAAARSLGATHGPVIVTDKLTPDQIRAYRIADNRTHDYTTWDYSMLAAELGELGSGFDDVLDLADWRGIVAQFEQSADAASLLLSPDARALVTAQHSVVVVFATAEDADAAGPHLLKLPGVLDVRYSR